MKAFKFSGPRSLDPTSSRPTESEPLPTSCRARSKSTCLGRSSALQSYKPLALETSQERPPVSSFLPFLTVLTTLSSA
ncbi:hypothetical protein BC827DRAFT_56613 [Russula dissimulans]|nr:hypothetical protein BC827DRAFT_56613 [Russula dissimulans]